MNIEQLLAMTPLELCDYLLALPLDPSANFWFAAGIFAGVPEDMDELHRQLWATAYMDDRQKGRSEAIRLLGEIRKGLV